MSPEDEANQFIAFRLGEFEKRLDKMEKHVDARFDALQGSIGSLAFVRKDVYESDQRAVARDLLALTEKVDASRSIAMWALGTTLTVVAVVGTLIGILRVAGG